jgi:hypothetical protein
VDENFAGGGKVGAGDAQLADDALRAGDDFVAAGAPCDGHEEGGDESEGKTDRQGNNELDAHLRDGTVDQKQTAEGECDDAPDGEDAVGDEFCLQGEQDKSQGDESERGVAGRQQIQGKEGEQNEDDADDTGDDGSGVIEFGVQGEGSDGQDQEGDVGVHEPAQDALAQAGGKLFDGLVGEVEGLGRSVKALDAAAIELVKQVGFVARGEIDEMEVEGFLLGPRDGLADGFFGFRRVASAAGNIGAQKGRRVVLDLGLHDFVGLGAAEGDGVGRSGVGAVGHGRDIGGLENEESGGGGASPVGCDEDDDGNRGGFDFGDDLASGIKQAARGVEFDEQGGGVPRLGGVYGARDALGGDGLDGSVDAKAQDLRVRRQSGDEQQKREKRREKASHGYLRYRSKLMQKKLAWCVTNTLHKPEESIGVLRLRKPQKTQLAPLRMTAAFLMTVAFLPRTCDAVH